MKKILPILLFFLSLFLFLNKVYAYTLDDVKVHNTSNDCWVVFEQSVYDLTKYLPNHDRFLDIREWCGKDMTEDFVTKDGSGRDHRPSSYSLLEQYKIGDFEQEKISAEPQITEEVSSKSEGAEDIVKESKEYNMIIPFIISCSLYWCTYFVIKRQKNKGLLLMKFNAFWNTVLILTLLIPSFGFGVFMLIRIQKPSLYSINFEFLYWHVELSLVMGFVAISHFIQRIAIYLKQVTAKINN